MPTSGVEPLPRGSSACLDAAVVCASISGLTRSIGSGKTTVVFWLTPISLSVCR